MLYKPNKLQLEDRLVGFSKNDVVQYARTRYFEYLRHYNLSNFSGLLTTTYNNFVNDVFKNNDYLNKSKVDNLLNKIDFELDKECQKIVKQYNIKYDRPTLYCLVGIPGSGKSHLAEEIK